MQAFKNISRRVFFGDQLRFHPSSPAQLTNALAWIEHHADDKDHPFKVVSTDEIYGRFFAFVSEFVLLWSGIISHR